MVKPPLVNHQSVQTIEKNTDKQSDSNRRLENAYKELELTCSKFKTEKHELERQLQIEREGIKKLKQEMEEQLSEKVCFTTILFVFIHL